MALKSIFRNMEGGKYPGGSRVFGFLISFEKLHRLIFVSKILYNFRTAIFQIKIFQLLVVVIS